MKAPTLAFVAVMAVAGCAQGDSASKPATAAARANTTAPEKPAAVTQSNESKSKDDDYVPPTPEEMAPMRAEYLAELAKIHEPPEMADMPMEVRRPPPPGALQVSHLMSTLGAPEKATHEQRATAIRELLEIANSNGQDDRIGRAVIYGAIAGLACINGVEPKTIIGYATEAIGEGDDGLALRARVYLQAGDRSHALEDLQTILANGDRQVLAGGDAAPRKASVPCRWSTADFDALGDDPRALAAKGLYLSSFIAYDAEEKGLVKESDIRDLYARSAAAWHSPIPHVLAISLNGLGSERSMMSARCIRSNAGGAGVPEIEAACAKADDGTRQ